MNQSRLSTVLGFRACLFTWLPQRLGRLRNSPAVAVAVAVVWPRPVPLLLLQGLLTEDSFLCSQGTELCVSLSFLLQPGLCLPGESHGENVCLQKAGKEKNKTEER